MPPAKYLALLCHQIWPSETIIPSITEVPVLFLSGLRDEMVPYVSIFLAAFPPPNDDFNFHPQKLKPFWAPIKILGHFDISDTSPTCSQHHTLHIKQHANLFPRRPSHMRRLYEICQSPTKVWKPLPGGDHNSSVLQDGYFATIAEFIGNLAPSKR
jgi:hypothetical protein